MSIAIDDQPSELDNEPTSGVRQFAKYERLGLLDRHDAERLNQFCKVNGQLGAVGTRLANRAFWQSLLTSIPLAIADFFSLYASLFVSSLVFGWFSGISSGQVDNGTTCFIALIILPIAHLAGLYPALGLGSVAEFRQTARAMFASLLVFAGLGWFLFPSHWLFYSLTAAFAFAIGLPLMATLRFITRHLAQACPWWGVPTLIVAGPERGAELFLRLQRSRTEGFRPVGVLLDNEQYWGESIDVLKQNSIPHFDIRHTDEIALEHGATWAIVSPCSKRELSPSLDRTLAAVPNRIVLSSSRLEVGLWDEIFCVGATAGLRLGGACPSSAELVIKRAIDILFTSAAVIVGSPVIAILCLLVRLSSRGPVFYGQPRIGRGGELFMAWKFRSMLPNADRVLDHYLASNPAARAEWEEKHKLTNDPRVTSIGRFLRASSLDELPQLWNVLVGDMSLVGPRPIINSPTYDAAYVQQYPDEFEAYKTVRPGLTGLWQVRARNSGVYELRIYWDMYYIRNWCVWLDLYLIMRTLRTVVMREGM